MSIPVIGFAGYSDAGKTTFIEKVLIELKKRGIRTAVIKHDAHSFEIDHEGKDSYRFKQAGADVTVVTSDEQTATIGTTKQTLDDIVATIKDVDLILVEGFKNADIPQFGMARQSAGISFPRDPSAYVAVITEEPVENVLCFSHDDAYEVAQYIGYMIAKPVDFTHFDDEGHARMVYVGDKEITKREAVAVGRVLVNRNTFELIKSGGMKKGDVLTVAQVAGIMGAKNTSALIPMCHPIVLDGIDLRLSLNEEDCCVDIESEVTCTGRTGVEMEALTAVSSAALTVYDMCKAVQKDIEIKDIRLVRKTGGYHGDYSVNIS